MKTKKTITLFVLLIFSIAAFSQQQVMEIYKVKNNKTRYVIDHEKRVFFNSYNSKRKKNEAAVFTFDRVEGNFAYFAPKSEHHKEIKKDITKPFKIGIRNTGTWLLFIITSKGPSVNGIPFQNYILNNGKWGVKIVDSSED